MRSYHFSIHTMRNLIVIKMMLLLSVSTIFLIPLADILASPVLGQASIVADAPPLSIPPLELQQPMIPVPPAPPISIPPLELQQPMIPVPPAPPISIPPLELQQPMIPVPPEASVISGTLPGLNGLIDPFQGSLFTDPAETPSQSLEQQLSLTSPVSSFDSTGGAQSKIYACMDVASGNIPVNSLKSSPESGCPFRTVPVVIMSDDSSGTVSTCFVAPDLVTPTDNCIPSASPLQQQQQQPQAISPPILSFQ